MFDGLVPAQLFQPFLVFARLGTAMMLLPGFGELYVPQRYRLLLALLLSVILAPALSGVLPALPSRPDRLVSLLGAELVVGIFIGSLARLMLLTLETTGSIISLQLGLSNAQIFNPLAGGQGSLPGTFLTMMGVVVIFATDTHHLMLRGLVDSYGLFAPGDFPVIGDLSLSLARTVAASFRLGLQLASPFLVAGTVFFAAMGVIGRLVPQLQLFFVAMPVQILGGLALLAFALTVIMQLFAEHFAEAVTQFVP